MKKFTRRHFLKFGTSSLLLLTASGCTSLRAETVPMKTPLPDLEIIECDYLIHKGLIVDGSGTTPFIGDLAIKGDKIVKVAQAIYARDCKVIDGQGKVVVPGFIDLHTHTEHYMLSNGKAEMILTQGVTTQIGGNCGRAIPDVKSYLNNLQNLGINYGIFTGYRDLRQQVFGSGGATLNGHQVREMIGILENNLHAGAFGLSVALEYWPQNYATLEEMVELAQVVARYGGLYSVHIRNEGDRVLEAVEELVEIGLRAKVPVQYSHIKTAYKRNWGKMEQVLHIIEEARRQGLDIKADAYGYDFASYDLGGGAISISEEDLERALSHPQVFVGSDSGLNNSGGAIHPRAYANYPRILGRYVRDKQILSLEAAINKMTYEPAKRLGLNDRGILTEGMKADVVVFDLDSINDLATRREPNATSKGVETVFVNGKLALHRGQPTGITAGAVLRNTIKG
ncbi:MAG: D-aminoacylase [Bacillota bacterium]